MPLISPDVDLGFIDDGIEAVMGGLDDLFSNKEERQKARNELQKLKNKLKEDTRDHVEEMASMHLEDRQHARSVQKKSLQKAWWMMPVLAVLVFVGFFGVLGGLMFFSVPEQAQAPLNIMLGTLGSLVMLIGHFLWGSSQGSKEKADHLRELTTSLQPSTTQPSNKKSAPTQTRERTELERTVSEVEPVPHTPQAKTW